MTQKLNVKRGGAGVAVTEVMDMVAVRKGAPVFEGSQPLIDMGRAARDGEASQGTFRLVDPDAEIHSTSYRLSPHALVTWTEDASGDELWLARSRISPLESGRRAYGVGGDEVEWDITVNDNNMDLRGQNFAAEWVRPAETDIERIIALQAYTLNGFGSTAVHHRKTCEITCDTDTNGHLMATGAERNMPAKTYPAGTLAQEVIADCAERTGKTYAVVIHHDGGDSHDCLLYVSPLDHDTYQTAVKVSDHIADSDIDDPTAPVFYPVWDRGKGTLTENDDVLSGLVSVYGGSSDNPKTIFVHQDTDEEPYEYWTDVVFDDKSENATEAENRANQILTAHRAPGHRTHRFSILIHRSQHALLNAGMSMQVKSAVIAGGDDLNTYVWRRITELRWENHPDPEWIWAHIDLEKPLRRRGSAGQPAATTNPNTVTRPPTCELPGADIIDCEMDISSGNDPDWPGTYVSTAQGNALDPFIPYKQFGAGASCGCAMTPDQVYKLSVTLVGHSAYAWYRANASFKDSGGNWIRDGGGNIVHLPIFAGHPGGEGYLQLHTYEGVFTAPTDADTVCINLEATYGGWVIKAAQISHAATQPDNDPDCIPADSGDPADDHTHDFEEAILGLLCRPSTEVEGLPPDVASVVGSGTTAGSPLNVNYPSSITAGQLLVTSVIIFASGRSASTPAGWTLIDGPYDDTNGARSYLFGKIATGSESGSLAVSFIGSAGGTRSGLMFTVDDPGASPWAEGISHTSGSGTTVSAPSVTAGGPNRRFVAVTWLTGTSAIGDFTGESGGNWAEVFDNGGNPRSQIQTATGTAISGGTTTITSMDWRVTGFAFAPTVTVTPGDGNPDLVGEDTRVTRCDHAHHVFRDTAPVIGDDTDAGYPNGTLWIEVDDLTTPTAILGTWTLLDNSAGAAVWAQFGSAGVTDFSELTGTTGNILPQYRLTTDGGQDVVNVVSAAGSTETLDLADGNVHDVTLTADCTLTLTGATAGVECSMAVLLRQGSGAPWDVTWPGSVEWVGGSAPTLETAANAWNWVNLTTLDGGTVWFGDGGGAAAALSDDTPLVDSGSGDPGVGTEASRSDHVHPASTSGPPQILLESGHATPFTFDEILQESDGSDFLWASE